jgi:hypothetical protein
MARPAGQMLEEVDAERDAKIPRRVFREAVEQVRVELEEYVKTSCSTPNPPPFTRSSKDGDYPRARTFEFVDGLSVVYSEDAGAFRLYSKTHDGHGRFLAEGLRDGTTRPYGRLVAEARDWNARVQAVAKRMNE